MICERCSPLENAKNVDYEFKTKKYYDQETYPLEYVESTLIYRKVVFSLAQPKNLYMDL